MTEPARLYAVTAEVEREQDAPALLTRYGDVVKLQGGTDAACNRSAPNTTTPAKEIVMPSHDIAPSVLAAIQAAAVAVQAWPRRSTKPKPTPWRRGVKRGIGKLPMVYAMRCTTCGIIKIGISGDYRQRRVELEKRTGHTLDVLGIEIGPIEAEAALHRHFRRHRIEGEWYRPDDQILTYIRERMNLPYEKREPYVE